MAAKKIGIRHDGKELYASENGLKIGVKSKITPAAIVLGQFDKSKARQVRKALHKAGLVALAAAERVTAANH